MQQALSHEGASHSLPSGQLAKRTMIVTGASGFIGRELVDLLDQAGHTVVAFGDEDQLDVQNASAVRQAIAETQPDIVFHLAAVSGPMLLSDRPEIVTQVNAVGTVNVLESARSTGSRVVLASSVAGYSSGSFDDPLPTSVYGATKRFVEVVGRVYRAQYDMDVTSARIGSVYGIERKTEHVLHRMIDQALHDGVIEYEAERWEPLVHVVDCARLLAGLAEVPSWREDYDVVTTPRTHLQLAEAVRSALFERSITLHEVASASAGWARVFDPAPLFGDTGVSPDADVDSSVAKLAQDRADRTSHRPSSA